MLAIGSSVPLISVGAELRLNAPLFGQLLLGRQSGQGC